MVITKPALSCPVCGIHLEPVAWARPGAQPTRDFEDMVAWLAQQMAKTQITRLQRIGWATVGQIVSRVVADQLDERRLEGPVSIGCDEISYRRGQRYWMSLIGQDRTDLDWRSTRGGYHDARRPTRDVVVSDRPAWLAAQVNQILGSSAGHGG